MTSTMEPLQDQSQAQSVEAQTVSSTRGTKYRLKVGDRVVANIHGTLTWMGAYTLQDVKDPHDVIAVGIETVSESNHSM